MSRLFHVRWCAILFSVAATVCAASAVYGQIDGKDLALKSTGAEAGTGWVLDQNGYVGTYVTLDAPGNVTFTINASGQADGGSAPHMNLVVDDTKVGWDVSSTASDLQTTVSLPAGTHFVRTEFANAAPTAPNRTLTIDSLNVTGATVSNDNSDANALAAANEYIANYRQGPATVSIVGMAPGTPVHVEMTRGAFNFGTAVGGDTSNLFLTSNPAPGSTAYNYQQALSANFNTIVTANSAMWQNNEATRGVVTTSTVGSMLQYAASHNMDARVHNLIWGESQPAWVNTLLSQAAAGNTAARDDLRQAISQRIAYLVHDQASQFQQIDVLNEGAHQPAYMNVFGASGIASIYNEVAQAAQQAGAHVTTFTNEYGVLQSSTNPTTGAPDPYANWYRNSVESIRNAGGTVGGIGVQYYVDTNSSAPNFDPHSAAHFVEALQNLSIEGLPIVLTEYGALGGPGQSTDPATQANILENALRLVYGTPQAAGFTMWGFWQGDIWDKAPNAALYDSNWNLTQLGLRWQSLMSQWSTDLDLSINADGTINFNGFYGDYLLRIGDRTIPLSFAKGTSQYNINLTVLGDTNGDGRVDANDFNYVTSNFGGSGVGDTNGDGRVDVNDYNNVQNNYGPLPAGAVGLMITTVPEPTALVLSCIGGLLWQLSWLQRAYAHR